MTRTEVAREVRDELHTTEAALDAMIAQADATLARLVSARAELGLSGTLGEAGVARMRDTIASLRDAREALIETHREAYAVMKATNIRGVAYNPTDFGTGSASDDIRAA